MSCNRHVSLFRLESTNLHLPPNVAAMQDPNWILQLKEAKEWDGIIALYKDKLAMLTAMFPMLHTHPSPSTSQAQLGLGHCLSSGTVTFPWKLSDAISVTAQQADAGESSGPFDHPPTRARPTQHRTLHRSEVAPRLSQTFRIFSNFSFFQACNGMHSH